MDWNFIMNTAFATIIASVIASICALAGVFITHWFDYKNGYKDINAKLGKLDDETLVGHIDQKLGKLDNTTLVGFIDQKVGNLNNQIGEIPNTTLSGQHNTILSAVQSLEGQIKSSKERDDLKRQQLTGDQARIGQSIETLSAFAKLMVDLQAQNNVLLQENQTLKQENSQLKEQVEEFQQAEAPEEESQEEGITLS